MIKNFQTELALRGRIAIGLRGEKKKGANDAGGTADKKYGPPQKLDHFIITTLENDAVGRPMYDTALMDRLKEEQSGVPYLKEIPIRLLFDENDLNFYTCFSCFTKVKVLGKERLGCWCTGDNEKAKRLNEDGKYCEVQCPCERIEKSYSKGDKCKPFGTLYCLIEGTNRVGGVWKYSTSGWNSVKSITSSMKTLKTVTGGGQIDSEGNPVGPLAWIPLKMVVFPKSTVVPQSGIPVTIYVVRLDFDGTNEQLSQLGYETMKKRIEHGMKMGRLQKQENHLIVAPYQESPEDQEQTAAEFCLDTDQGFEQPPGPDVDPRVRATIGEGTATKPDDVSQNSSEAADASPQSTGASAESSPAANAQNEEGHTQEPKPMTIKPEVIEACQANKPIPSFPIPLITTKNVAIGHWVGREMDKLGLHTNKVIFEMVPEMTELTRLTEARISKEFAAAGYKVIFQAPGTMKMIKEAQEETLIPPVEQLPDKQPGGNGGQPRQLF